MCGPGIDRHECFITASQFLLEGTATVLLLSTNGGDGASAGGFERELTFLLALIAMLLPLVLALYDGLFLGILRRMQKKNEFTLKAAAFATLSVLFYVPGLVAELLDCDLGHTNDMTIATLEQTTGVVGTSIDEIRAALEAVPQSVSDLDTQGGAGTHGSPPNTDPDPLPYVTLRDMSAAARPPQYLNVAQPPRSLSLSLVQREGTPTRADMLKMIQAAADQESMRHTDASEASDAMSMTPAIVRGSL